MFRGETSIVIDDKGRLAIPKGFRERLIARWGKPVKLTLTFGLTPEVAHHRHLVARPTQEWEAYEARMSEVSPFDWETRKVTGMLIGSANDVELDRQGRFVIPPSLRTFASLETESRARIVGQGREFQLWDEKKRIEYLEHSIATIGESLKNPSPGLLAITPGLLAVNGEDADDPRAGAGGSGA